jgi:hypothetical protein
MSSSTFIDNCPHLYSNSLPGDEDDENRSIAIDLVSDAVSFRVQDSMTYPIVPIMTSAFFAPHRAMTEATRSVKTPTSPIRTASLCSKCSNRIAAIVRKTADTTAMALTILSIVELG